MSLRTLPWKKPPHVHELTFGEFIYLLEQDDVRLRSKALSEIFPELLGGDTPKPPPKKKVDIWRELNEFGATPADIIPKGLKDAWAKRIHDAVFVHGLAVRPDVIREAARLSPAFHDRHKEVIAQRMKDVGEALTLVDLSSPEQKAQLVGKIVALLSQVATDQDNKFAGEAKQLLDRLDPLWRSRFPSLDTSPSGPEAGV